MATKKKAENPTEGEEILQGDTVEGPVDLTERVKVEITDDHEKHHYDVGEVIECSPVLASKIVKNGWGKILKTLALLMMFALGVSAQSTSTVTLKVRFANADVLTDTVTNTATGYVSTLTAIVNPALSTTVQVNIVKISGTVAGTVTLQGSVDNVYWSTATSGALAITATYTATDVATQSKNWVIANSPYKYYRATWTGTGTMSATIGGVVWSH